LVVAKFDDIISLYDPDKFLDGVVKIEFDLNVGVDGGFITSELELFNEVFVGGLGETSSFIGIEVDVIDEEGSVLKGGYTEGIELTVAVNTAGGEGSRGGNIAFVLLAEIEFDLNFVVLEGNKGEGKTRVSAEPELKGYIESSGFSSGKTSSGKGDGVTNHVVITSLKTRGDGEFVPDGKPVTVLLIDSLTTDLYFDGFDKDVTDEVDPSEESRGDSGFNTGEGYLEVYSVD
jgi:hypothetical protein